MRERQTTVYYCDHCSKKGFYKSTISKHEQTCFGNEENVPACLKRPEGIESQCIHLERDTAKSYYYCSKLRTAMHSKRSEVMKYPIPEGSLLMPSGCTYYQPDITIMDNPF